MTRYSGSVKWYSLKQMGLGLAVIQNIVQASSKAYVAPAITTYFQPKVSNKKPLS